MSTLQELYQLSNSSSTVSLGASQEDLDNIGLLLDELERVEAFLDTNCSSTDRKDAEAERLSLADRLDVLVNKV
jgi:hypothetical protein